MSIFLNEDIAEVVGAFIGDGCLSRHYDSRGSGAWREVVMFTGAWDKDSGYYKCIIKPTIDRYIGAKFTVYHRMDDDTVRFMSHDKKIVTFLLDLGFKFGPKCDDVSIPDAIMSKYDLKLGCLRGIFNTDGSIYRRYGKKFRNHSKHYSSYKVVQFKLNSRVLTYQIRDILAEMNLTPNRVITESKCSVCRITSQDKIRIFNEKINTTHRYHIERAKHIK
jgi:hypothetical protein